MPLDWGQSRNIHHVVPWEVAIGDGFGENVGDLIVSYGFGTFPPIFLTNVPTIDNSNGLPFLESGMRLDLGLRAELFVVPVPAAFWLFGSAFVFIGAFRKR